MQVSLRKGEHPTLTYVTVGTLELAFSYETVVGFRESYGSWVLSENVWSRTTGKHLNAIADKSARVDREEFKHRLNNALGVLGDGVPILARCVRCGGDTSEYEDPTLCVWCDPTIETEED